VSIGGVKHTQPQKSHVGAAQRLLLLRSLDWFFGDFLSRDEMTKERDGKITGELVVKALQRVLARSPRHRNFDLIAEYDRRRSQR